MARRLVVAGLMVLAAACSTAKDDASCANLPATYAASVAAAQTCAPNGDAGQCQMLVRSVIPCNCPTYVNDTTTLDRLNAEWQAKGCSLPAGTGCATGCPNERPRICVAADGGTGVCQVPGP
jgi:hypothetical protein